MAANSEYRTIKYTQVKWSSNLKIKVLFDKRDDFPFSIVKMPYLSSNIPYNIFYNTILSEMIRIAWCSLLYKYFLFKARELCQRKRNQGADVIFAKTFLLRSIKKHSPSWVQCSIQSACKCLLWLMFLIILTKEVFSWYSFDVLDINWLSSYY